MTTSSISGGKKSFTPKSWFIIIGIILVAALAFVTLVLWPNVIQPSLNEQQEQDELAVLDGKAKTASEVDPGFLVKQEWMDGFTAEFMKEHSKDGLGVQVTRGYSATECETDVSKDCVGGITDYTFYFDPASSDDVSVTAFKYFTDLGLKPEAFVPDAVQLKSKVAKDNDVTVEELDSDPELFEKVAVEGDKATADFSAKGLESDYVDMFKTASFCVNNNDDLVTLVGPEIAATTGVSEISVGVDPCIAGATVSLTAPRDGVLWLQTWPGFAGTLDPAVVPEVEGKNYTRDEYNKLEAQYNPANCSPEPSLVHPYWLEWPDGEVKCPPIAERF